MMMPWNEEGSETKQFCAWVHAQTIRERKRERKRQTEKHQSTYSTKRKEEKGTYA